MFVIAGVSGKTGQIAAETLLARGKAVRVIVRSAEKGNDWKARGAEVAVTDLDDVTGMTAALRGAEGAYLLLPPQMSSTNPRADNGARAKRLAEAIEASGVKHVVFLSSVGAQLESGTGPILSVHDGEKTLGAVKADVTFLRAAYFMENAGMSLYALDRDAFPTFLAADNRIAMVATKDIGVAAANALVEGGHGKSVIELAGPRDYTAKEVAEALGRVLGKPIALEVGPIEAMKDALVGAGLNDAWAGLYAEMTKSLNENRVRWEGGSARFVRGATPIDDVLRATLKV